jgi:hypothetical protein
MANKGSKVPAGFSIIQKETIINLNIRIGREKQLFPNPGKSFMSGRFEIFTGFFPAGETHSGLLNQAVTEDMTSHQ